MSTTDKFDQVAGKVKEIAGKLAGDRNLEREGTVQHGVAKAKDTVKDTAKKVGEAVTRLTDHDKH